MLTTAGMRAGRRCSDFVVAEGVFSICVCRNRDVIHFESLCSMSEQTSDLLIVSLPTVMGKPTDR